MATGMVTQSDSRSTLESDPLRNFKFRVFFDNPHLSDLSPQFGFMSVDGLSVTTDVISYRQGGHNTTTQKLPGQSDFAPITLSKGVVASKNDQGMVKWLNDIFVAVQGTGSNDGSKNFRSTVTIYLIDHPVTTSKAAVKAAWRIYRAWPTSCAFGSLDAGANGVLMNQISLAHEGWEFKLANKNAGPSSVVSF
ncbi:phage tail protein [Streptomyces sp. NPDC088252]|uniref:phage tail protein n=1 Tax=Streptomyces sp. NPDC088252 TaxID=3365845 RepID=UPI00382DE57F